MTYLRLRTIRMYKYPFCVKRLIVRFHFLSQPLTLVRGESTQKTSANDGARSACLSCQFMPRWWAGLELLNLNEYGPAQSLGAHEGTAFFLGPNLHYAATGWWATLLVLPQLPTGTAYASDQKAETDHGLLLGDKFERTQVRLKFGFDL